MSENINRGNSTIKIKNLVWEVKVGINSSKLIHQHQKFSESKLWKIKVILN